MCCVITVLLFIGPRAALFMWYLLSPSRFQAAISSTLLACLGFLFLPWTTLAYLAAWNPVSQVSGFGWFVVAFGFVADLAMWFGGGYGNRNRLRR